MGDTPHFERPYFETTLTKARIDAMAASGDWPNDLLIDRFRANVEAGPTSLWSSTPPAP